MTRYDEAFLFLDPAGESVGRSELEHGGTRTALVWAPDAAAAARVAGELAAGGVRLIELYRGFDLPGAARVIEAVGGRVPVGVASGAAAGVRHSVTIFADDAADPDRVRTVRRHDDGGSTTVIGAPDAVIESVAEAEIAAGAELIQVCGGAPLTTAARVAATVGDRVAVGLVSWPFESITGAAAYKASWEQAHPSA